MWCNRHAMAIRAGSGSDRTTNCRLSIRDIDESEPGAAATGFSRSGEDTLERREVEKVHVAVAVKVEGLAAERVRRVHGPTFCFL